MFTPTVTTSDNQAVVPGVSSLVLTAFAPTVLTPVVVTPGVSALALAAFAPSITATNHVTVTPGTAALVLTTFTPEVTGSAVLVGAASWRPIFGPRRRRL
jgi:hypothetical protein